MLKLAALSVFILLIYVYFVHILLGDSMMLLMDLSTTVGQLWVVMGSTTLPLPLTRLQVNFLVLRVTVCPCFQLLGESFVREHQCFFRLVD